MHRVTRSSNQSSGSISDKLCGYFESESFLETFRKVVVDVVAEESFQLALKRRIDAAVGSTLEPLKEKLGGLDQYVARVNKSKESNLAMNKENDNEQYLRKYNLRFIGIEEQKDENCIDKIVSIKLLSFVRKCWGLTCLLVLLTELIRLEEKPKANLDLL